MLDPTDVEILMKIHKISEAFILIKVNDKSTVNYAPLTELQKEFPTQYQGYLEKRLALMSSHGTADILEYVAPPHHGYKITGRTDYAYDVATARWILEWRRLSEQDL